MKRIITLFSFCLCASMTLMNAQAIKVNADGNTCVGCSDPGNAQLKSNGTSEIEFAVDAAVGNADFTYQIGGISKGQIKYINSNPGITYNLSSANAGTGGVSDANTVLYLSASGNGFVGVNTTAPVATMDVRGDLRYTGSLINASDKRLKSNIASFDYGLDEVLKLNPVRYNYNGKAGIKSNERHIGLIAQELQKVSPELVTEFEHVNFEKQSQEDVDKELPTAIESVETYLQISESSIKYMLVNAIKDQQAIINEQNERIAALERKIESIAVSNEQNISLEDNLGKIASIDQNSPNPFNSETAIAYFVPEGANNAKIDIYSISGSLLKTVNISHTGKGVINLSAEGLSSGTFTYTLTVDGKSIKTNKMILQR